MHLPVVYATIPHRSRWKVREEYVRVQGGKCAHCHTLLSDPPTEAIQRVKILTDIFPPGFLDNPVHLHHDHKTGLTIGAVHARCNAYLWQYRHE